MAQSTAEVVRQAARVLDGELQAGVAASRRSQARFRKEGRVDPSDLQDAVARFREDGHALVDAASALGDELRAAATDDVAKRLVADAHDILDTVMDLVTLAPDLVTRLTRLVGNPPVTGAADAVPPSPKGAPAAGRR